MQSRLPRTLLKLTEGDAPYGSRMEEIKCLIELYGITKKKRQETEELPQRQPTS